MNIKALHRAMSRGLNEDDLRTICVYLSEAPSCSDLSYDKLSGNGAAIKALSLIDYCHKRRALNALIDTLHEGWATVLGDDYATWQTWATKDDTQLSSSPNLLSKIGLGRIFARTGSVKDLFVQLVRAEGERDWNTVIQLGEQILMMNPNHQLAPKRTAAAYELRGIDLISKGEYDAAISGFDRGIQLYPYPGFYYLVGVCLNKKGDYGSASFWLTKAIQDEARAKARYYYERGLSNDGLGHFNDAISDKTKAIELDVNNASYYFSRGESYRHFGTTKAGGVGFWQEALKYFDKAIKDYSSAINLNPDEAEYFYSRGMAFKAKSTETSSDSEAKRAKESARGDFQRAAELGHPSANWQLANLEIK